MTTVVDVDRLGAVLASRIEADGLSWRQAAGQIGVSPSLLSRLRQGQRPDLESYAKLVAWLRLPADEFLREQSADARPAPELNSAVSALLRARSDLSDDDKQLLESIFRAGIEHVQRSRTMD